MQLAVILGEAIHALGGTAEMLVDLGAVFRQRALGIRKFAGKFALAALGRVHHAVHEPAGHGSESQTGCNDQPESCGAVQENRSPWCLCVRVCEYNHSGHSPSRRRWLHSAEGVATFPHRRCHGGERNRGIWTHRNDTAPSCGAPPSPSIPPRSWPWASSSVSTWHSRQDRAPVC